MEVGDITRELSNSFQVDRGEIKDNSHVLDQYKAVIIAKPTKPFSEKDKFVLDQYLMNGGKLLWFVNSVNVNLDSLANGTTFGFINNLQIDDQLFTYGVRINPNLIEDIQCNVLPVNTGAAGDKAKWTPAPWLYYPLLSSLVDHPVSRNLEMVWARYASEIDTVGENKKIKKTILLHTSRYTKTVSAPLMINLQEIKKTPKQAEFNKPNLPVAMLLEGKFTSVFRNRMVKDIMPGAETNFKTESTDTKMIVVGDGNMIANDVRSTAKGPMVSALGYDKFTRQTFGNKEFVSNAVNYLTDETGLMNFRSKEFKLRILDKPRIREERVKWQVINTLVPVLLVLFFGIYYNYSRKKKYAGTSSEVK
jgi:ABC-2 type transport system permease protein